MPNVKTNEERCPACYQYMTIDVEDDRDDFSDISDEVTCLHCGAMVKIKICFDVTVTYHIFMGEYELPDPDTEVEDPDALQLAWRLKEEREAAEVRKRLGVVQPTFI
jgi:hypothetical protein